MNKALKILLRVLVGIVCLVTIVWMGAFVWSKVYYHDFYQDARRSISIPGIHCGFVPQGFAYSPEKEAFLISGYMKDDSRPSRIYMIGRDGSEKYVELFQESGAPYTAHCGGVAINGEYIYISGSKKICVFSAAEVFSGKTARQIGSISTGERMSFCSFIDGYLLTGTYASDGSYKTPEYFHVKTPAGDENVTLIWAYKADDAAPFGLLPVPVAALSAGAKVQGIEVTDDGKVILSTSYGLESSALWLYQVDDRMGTVTKEDVAIPLYYLDSASLVKTVKTPPMAEELVWLDGRVYVLTESACAKYIYGNLIDGRHVFAYAFS